MEKKYYVHPSSFVGEHAVVGNETRIWQFCNIMNGAEIGENCNLGQNTFMESGAKLGNRVTVKNNIALYAGVECEDDVFLGPNCVFTNVTTPRSFVSRKDEFKRTLVRGGGTIGANCTILCGHTIGRYAMVGAGSVVTKDVPDYALVVGNPAKMIGYVCQCGERIFEDQNGIYHCSRCDKKYMDRNGLIEI